MLINPEIVAEALSTGTTAMAVGMGIVFSFLVVLVFAMLIMANAVAWINKICPLPVAEVKTTKKATANDDSAIAIAIVAAMKAFKK